MQSLWLLIKPKALIRRVKTAAFFAVIKQNLLVKLRANEGPEKILSRRFYPKDFILFTYTNPTIHSNCQSIILFGHYFELVTWVRLHKICFQSSVFSCGFQLFLLPPKPKKHWLERLPQQPACVCVPSLHLFATPVVADTLSQWL